MRTSHHDRWPEPVVAGSFSRRRIVTGIRDLLSLSRIGPAAALAVVLRLIWAIVEQLTFYAGQELPGGLITWSCVLVFAGVLLFAPIELSLEAVSVTPLRLVVAPPHGALGPPPLAVRVAATIYIAAIVGGLWAVARPAAPGPAQVDRAVAAVLGGGTGLLLVVAATWARQTRVRRSRPPAGA